MSADAWAICPLCVVDARAEHDRKVRALNEAYGKLPREEWQAMDDELPDEFDPYSVEPTVREDYEIGFDGSDPTQNHAEIHYKGVCQTCGASATAELALELHR